MNVTQQHKSVSLSPFFFFSLNPATTLKHQGDDVVFCYGPLCNFFFIQLRASVKIIQIRKAGQKEI